MRAGLIVMLLVAVGACSGTDEAASNASPPQATSSSAFVQWLRGNEAAPRWQVVVSSSADVGEALAGPLDLARAESAARDGATAFRWLRDSAPAADDGTRAAERGQAAFDYCSEAFDYAVEVFEIFDQNKVDPLAVRLSECTRLLDVAAEVIADTP